MLNSMDIIGFVPTKDFARAQAFYRDVLGLSFVGADQFALVFRTGRNMIRIAKVEDFTAAPFTILGWETQDIDRLAGTLLERGVRFERYSYLKHDERGIWTAPSGDRVAWFKDPDGNTLSISQHVATALEVS
jgi:catechol 2,3-dioxygenase-like lactoylglutathione lyase family enzyme